MSNPTESEPVSVTAESVDLAATSEQLGSLFSAITLYLKKSGDSEIELDEGNITIKINMVHSDPGRVASISLIKSHESGLQELFCFDERGMVMQKTTDVSEARNPDSPIRAFESQPLLASVIANIPTALERGAIKRRVKATLT